MACPLLLRFMLGAIMCLDPKVAGLSNSDIVLFFLRRGTPIDVNTSQVYIKTHSTPDFINFIHGYMFRL